MTERHAADCPPDDLRVLILAAAQGPRPGVAYPRALQPLGDRPIIDYVLDLARQLARPEHIHIVVGYQHEAIEAHLGPAYRYVLQEDILGTGHATLQAKPQLADYDGDLLVLYGDTPLFRLSSLKGMLTRHRLKAADLTLLTGTTDEPLPYGRVVRDASGGVVDVIEEAYADERTRGIRELNLGAYVARAPRLFAVLGALEAAGQRDVFPLTDVVRCFAKQGARVEAYRSADEEEFLGINTPEDLEAAELILQKRILRPRRIEEENIIQFGTGGWRAVIGEGFTLHNVRRLSQALAGRLLRTGQEESGVLIGYDRRFLSNSAAEAAAEVFAGNNVPVTLPRARPHTPGNLCHAQMRAAYGLAFTAHTIRRNGTARSSRRTAHSLPDEETGEIEAEANAPTTDDVVRGAALARTAGLVRDHYTNEYVDAVERLGHGGHPPGGLCGGDPMYGVGEVTINIVLTEARCRVVTIHGRHDPFGGRSPAPDIERWGC